MMSYIIFYWHYALSVKDTLSYFHPVFVWTGENDSNRLRMDVYILIIKQLTYNSKPLKRILLLREGLGD